MSANLAFANKLDVLDLVVFQIKIDHLRAGAGGLILIHNDNPFFLQGNVSQFGIY